MALSVPAEVTGRIGSPAHLGNCVATSERTSSVSISASSACIRVPMSPILPTPSTE
jgi:hypothetical protein